MPALLCEGLSLRPDEPAETLEGRLRRLTGPGDYRWSIRRSSIDARPRAGRDSVRIRYQLILETEDRRLAARLARKPGFSEYREEAYAPALGELPWPSGLRPVVVGFGPAGLFAAYLLAREGYRPLVLERGRDVASRSIDVEAFWSGAAPLNTESNVQFGEGGAGTFSDGKLTSRSKDPRQNEVLRILVENGAPPEILHQARAHIGTDRLAPLVKRMRERILAWGGELRFGCRFEGFATEGERLTQIACAAADGGEGASASASAGELLPCDRLILAIGHSARDTFRRLYRRGLRVRAKPFAVGLRIEIEQAALDRRQYGRWAGLAALGPADFRIKAGAGEREVYSFCMCPGGEVIAAASERGRLVVNGMSRHARAGKNANAAVLVGVAPGRDFDDAPLGGLAYQEGLEEAAFALGGGNFCAPVQSLGAFLKGAGPAPGLGSIVPSYRPAWREAELAALFSNEVTTALRQGLTEFQRKMPDCFVDDAVLSAVEARTSSPLRLLRDPQSLEAVGLRGVFPCGEGAGYAGGIVSSAIDGLRAAERVMAERRPLV